MTQLESKIQSVCLNYLYKTFRAIRISTPTKVGDPDTVACIYGYYVEIEFKKLGGKQSSLQKIAQRKCIKAGGKYWVIKGILDLMDNISYLRKKNEKK